VHSKATDLVRRRSRHPTESLDGHAEDEDDLVEVADLFFADGTTTRTVPFESFSFVD
jgi:hypothetical protein